MAKELVAILTSRTQSNLRTNVTTVTHLKIAGYDLRNIILYAAKRNKQLIAI